MNSGNLDFESDKILTELPKEDKLLFIGMMDDLSFKKGQLIYYESGIPTGVFLLKKGKAKIFKTGPYGKDQIFYIYKPGDLFGYHALLCHEKYEDSCEALEGCEVLFLSSSKFDHLLDQIPSLKNLFLLNISHEFGVMVNTITILAQKPLRQKVAIYLCLLDSRYFDQKTQSSDISLSREDLANIVGTTRESLIRQLKEFKEDKLIRIDKRNITILDKDRLEKLGNS